MRDIAWCAGLFEGEGSLSFGNNKQARMRLGSSDLDVLEAFTGITGTGNISGPYRGQGSKTPEHYKLMYYWNAGKITDIRELLDKFWPYLSCRRKEQAEKILAQYDSYPRMPQRANTRYKKEGGDV